MEHEIVLFVVLFWLMGSVSTTWFLGRVAGEPWDWSVFTIDLIIWPIVLMLAIWSYWKGDDKFIF